MLFRRVLSLTEIALITAVSRTSSRPLYRHLPAHTHVTMLPQHLTTTPIPHSLTSLTPHPLTLPLSHCPPLVLSNSNTREQCAEARPRGGAAQLFSGGDQAAAQVSSPRPLWVAKRP